VMPRLLAGGTIIAITVAIKHNPPGRLVALQSDNRGAHLVPQAAVSAPGAARPFQADIQICAANEIPRWMVAETQAGNGHAAAVTNDKGSDDANGKNGQHDAADKLCDHGHTIAARWS